MIRSFLYALNGSRSRLKNISQVNLGNYWHGCWYLYDTRGVLDKFKWHKEDKSSSYRNFFEQQEILEKAKVVKNSLKASTWRELETKGKFNKNVKLTIFSKGMLILGCNIGSETHYVREIDARGRTQ